MGKPVRAGAGDPCPLFLHRTGQWAKKVRGRTHYFGTDRRAALARWKAEGPKLLAGIDPRAAPAVLVRDVCNRFLTAKLSLRDAGELSPRTWSDYYVTCDRLLGFAAPRPVADLAPADFERYRATLARTLGPVRLGNEVQRARTVFKWAFDNGLVPAPVRFGTTFRKPAKKVVRRHRQAAGPRLLDPATLRAAIDAASPQLRAMILLGLNCGFGQTDVATLPRSALDLAAGWVTFPRPKTAVDRRCPLWPETVKALKAAAAVRPEPKNSVDADLVFLTHHGRPWVRCRPREGAAAVVTDAVRVEFQKVLAGLGVKRKGLGFYVLRHCFRTAADAARDPVAIDLIMGHTDPSMGAAYRERVDDDRLRAVVKVVRDWLGL